MINTKSLLIKLGRKFPRHLALKNNDPYVGLQCGKLKERISKIVLCLDLDASILDEIIEIKPDLVITHHPFIYGTPAKVFESDPSKKLIVDKLEANDIAVYSYHTNFDEGEGGMNDALAKALNLENIHQLETLPMARGGTLPTPMSAKEFAYYALDAFDVSYGLLIDEGEEVIETVALIGGGGSYHWYLAKDAGYDIYISGDIPHHRRREITVSKYNYLDLPHEIERIFMPTMKKILLDIEENLEVIIIDHEKLPKLIQEVALND
ncbi:MAG: Nif3-like dinuclear metal center hexameric protein [Erysipelotrichaceae bacterium]|nr:Nif3-like dinuclear metal center hexameric protein [Erysipelotrichaceae bacterium]